MTQGLVAFQRPARTASQQPEAFVQTIADLGGAHRADACRGQFDRKRNTIEPSANLADRLRIIIRCEIGRHRTSTVGEQGNGRRLCSLAETQRRYRPNSFAVHHQRLAAGGKHVDLFALSNDLARHRRSGIYQVFAIVQHEKQLPSSQRANDALVDGLASLLRDTEDSGYRMPDGGWIPDCSEFYQPGAIAVTGHSFSRNLNRQPGLADSSDTCERY